MICVKCYDQGRITYAAVRCQACGNNKVFVRKDKMMTNALVKQEVMDIPDLPHPSQIFNHEIIMAIAVRLQMTYSPPKTGEKIDTIEEFCLVVEKALAKGYHPLGDGFHYWKQNGEIEVADHYATWVRWAQGVDKFAVNPVTVEDNNGWLCTVTIVRGSDTEKLQAAKIETLTALTNGGMKVEEAIKIAEESALKIYATVRTGYVEKKDVYGVNSSTGETFIKNTPKGWTPGVTRAEVRAIKNAIRAAFGVPTPADIRQLIFRDLGIEQERALELAATMDPAIAKLPAYLRERYIKLQAFHEQEVPDDGLSREERIALLRGPDFSKEPGIGDDPVIVSPSLSSIRQGEDAIEVLQSAADEQELQELRDEAGAAAAILEIKMDDRQKLIESLFKKSSLLDLNEVELENLVQYLARFSLLKFSDNLSETIKLIPEVGNAEDKKIAITRLKQVVRDLSESGEVLPDLEVEKENAQNDQPS